MKGIFLLLLTTLLLAGCNSDDSTPQPISEIDKLPPPTQTGANTVGCLVDGKAFLPYGDSPGSGGNPRCDYIDGVFLLMFSNLPSEHPRHTITINLQNINYNLNNIEEAKYIEYRKSNIIYFKTDENNLGELYISKFDRESGIISGTFWFDAVNKKGEKVEIREGRFDMQYYGN